MKVTKIFQWDAAHRLALPYKSKCTNMHGHTYKVEVELEGDLNNEGMVLDFSQFKGLVAPANFDHQTINEMEWFKQHDKNPTAENLVLFIKEMLEITRKPFHPKIRRIRVWETPNSFAEEIWEDNLHDSLQLFSENSKKLEQMNTALTNLNKQVAAQLLKLKKVGR